MLNNDNIQSCKPYLYMVCLFVLSFSVVLVLSTSTSFLYSYREQLDSVVFQVIGREWINGYLPYRDLWDLKGPIIFFINALGFLLTGSRYGILVIQAVFLFFSFYIVFNYYREKVSSLKALIGILLICCVLSVVYEGGNMVEEFLLPLLIYSFIKMNDWFNNVKEQKYNHKWQFALVYGISLGFSLLTRLTNALPLCFGVLYIAIFLICKREWRIFLKNLVAFMIGFVLIVLPFFVYFLVTDVINDYFGTLDFGFRYFGQSTQTFEIKKLVLFNFPVFFQITVIAVGTIYNRNYQKFMFWLLVSFVSLYWIINSRGYYHYSIIFLPYMVISLYEIISLNTKCRRIALLIVFLFIIRGVKHDLSYYNRLDDVKSSNLIIKKMIDMIPIKDRGDMIIYGDIITPYLYSGIRPNKFFYLQEENAGISPLYKTDMLKDFVNVFPEYVIIEGKADSLKQTLDGRYQIYYTESNVMIYKKLNNEGIISNIYF